MYKADFLSFLNLVRANILYILEGANGGTEFSVNYYFLANSQLTTSFGWLLTFTFLQRILFRQNITRLFILSARQSLLE